MLAQRVSRPRIIQPFRVTRKPCKSYLTILEGRARFHWNVFMVVVLKGDIFILDDWLIDPNHDAFSISFGMVSHSIHETQVGERFVARIWKTPHKQVVAKDRATNICRSRSVGVSTWSLEEHGESHTCRSAMWFFCNSMLGCKEKVAKAFFWLNGHIPPCHQSYVHSNHFIPSCNGNNRVFLSVWNGRFKAESCAFTWWVRRVAWKQIGNKGITTIF